MRIFPSSENAGAANAVSDRMIGGEWTKGRTPPQGLR